ncbi:septal ring lytic transglycosylase RlpA family protein [Flavobacterium sp. CBA20B-1]|uniref:septal ring lytic transglycosylase RlpA family protein n=1 Tax=unclassified Flavobacterium TaxID=196869 RepID=UPI002225731A|nr:MULTISPECIES: septal ring lytic transglycosylase RlpA family protein [unclassified Flavobacterium]WCM43506.1 septal ring lytic transglycosylase RlpA family protein [Flavobacterium sp. CBA20B-1]
MCLASCKTAKTNKKTETSLFKNEVFACYYHDKFNGRTTANGEIFSNNKQTAAHKTLPFGTKVKVTNLANNKSVEVLINDRGPFTKGLEIDLSKKAFNAISHDKKAGKLKVKLELVNPPN